MDIECMLDMFEELFDEIDLLDADDVKKLLEVRREIVIERYEELDEDGWDRFIELERWFRREFRDEILEYYEVYRDLVVEVDDMLEDFGVIV